MKRTDVEALIGKKPGPERLDGDLLDLPGAPRPDAETPAPPRYLPTFDATLLVHARRTQILPEEHRPRIFNTRPLTRRPRSSSTGTSRAGGATRTAGSCARSSSASMPPTVAPST